MLFRTECRGIPNVGHIGVECSSGVTDAVANISGMELMWMTCANSLTENTKRLFCGFRRCDSSQMRDFAFAFRSEREQVIEELHFRWRHLNGISIQSPPQINTIVFCIVPLVE
jgi:hypothetical protein